MSHKIDGVNYDLADIKLGMEMFVTCLPIHEPEDVERLTATFVPGIEWGKAAYAMGVDIWHAMLRNKMDGLATFHEYLEFTKQCIAYMQNERDELPDVIANDPELAEAMRNRRIVIAKAVEGLQL